MSWASKEVPSLNDKHKENSDSEYLEDNSIICDDWVDYDLEEDSETVTFTSETTPEETPPKYDTPSSDVQTIESPEIKKRKLASFDELLQSLDCNILSMNFMKLLKFLQSVSKKESFTFISKDYIEFFKKIVLDVTVLRSRSLDPYHKEICETIIDVAKFENSGYLLNYVCKTGNDDKPILVIQKMYVMPLGTVSHGFKSHCLRSTIDFINNDITNTKEFLNISPDQAHFLQIILESVTMFADVGKTNAEIKKLYNTLTMAVNICSSKYEFRIRSIESDDGKKSVVFEKVPKQKSRKSAAKSNETAFDSNSSLLDSNNTTDTNQTGIDLNQTKNPPEIKSVSPTPKFLKIEDLTKQTDTLTFRIQPNKRYGRENKSLFVIKLPTDFVIKELKTIIDFLKDKNHNKITFVPKTVEELSFYRKCIDWCRINIAESLAGTEIERLHDTLAELLTRMKCKVPANKKNKINEGTGLKEVVYRKKPEKIPIEDYVQTRVFKRKLSITSDTTDKIGKSKRKKKVNLQSLLNSAGLDQLESSTVLNINQSLRSKKKQKQMRNKIYRSKDSPASVDSSDGPSNTTPFKVPMPGKYWSEDTDSESSSDRSVSRDRKKKGLDSKLWTDVSQAARAAQQARVREQRGFEKQRKHQLIEALSVPVQSDKAMKMMRGMGWSGGALGARGDGITEPIMLTLDRARGAGLGHGKRPQPPVIPNKSFEITPVPSWISEKPKKESLPSWVSDNSEPPKVTIESNNDIIVEKTKQLLIENPTFEALIASIERSKSGTSNVQLQKQKVELPNTIVELPKQNIDLPKQSDELPKQSVELPKQSDELPKPSNDELPKPFNIEPPKPSNDELSKPSNVEISKPSNVELPKPCNSNVDQTKPNLELSEQVNMNIQLTEQIKINTKLAQATQPSSELSKVNIELPKSNQSNVETSKVDIQLPKPSKQNFEITKDLKKQNLRTPEPNIELQELKKQKIQLSAPKPNDELTKSVNRYVQLSTPTIPNSEMGRPILKTRKPIKPLIDQSDPGLRYLKTDLRRELLRAILDLLMSDDKETILKLNGMLPISQRNFVFMALKQLRMDGSNCVFHPHEYERANRIRELYSKMPHIVLQAVIAPNFMEIEIKKLPVNMQEHTIATPKTYHACVSEMRINNHIKLSKTVIESPKQYESLKFKVLFLLNILDFVKSLDEELVINVNKKLVQKQHTYIRTTIEEINQRLKTGGSPAERLIGEDIRNSIKDAFLGFMFDHQHTSITINKYFRFKRLNRPDNAVVRSSEATVNLDNFTSVTSTNNLYKALENVKENNNNVTDNETVKTDNNNTVATTDKNIVDNNINTVKVSNLPTSQIKQNSHISQFLHLYEKEKPSNDNIAKTTAYKNETDNRNDKGINGNGNIGIANDNQLVDIKTVDGNDKNMTKDTKSVAEYVMCVDRVEDVIDTEKLNETEVILNKEINGNIKTNDKIGTTNHNNEAANREISNDTMMEEVLSNTDTTVDFQKYVLQDKIKTDVTMKDGGYEPMEVIDIKEAEIDKQDESLEVLNKKDLPVEFIGRKEESAEVTNETEELNKEIDKKEESVEDINKKDAFSKEIDVKVTQTDDDNSIKPNNDKIAKAANLDDKPDCDIKFTLSTDNQCDNQSVRVEVSNLEIIETEKDTPNILSQDESEVKNVYIVHKNYPITKMTKSTAMTTQKGISLAIEKTKELPLLMCHGVMKGALIYTCHNKKSFDWLKNTIESIDDLKFINMKDVTKMALKFYCFFDFDTDYLFKMIDLYNPGISTKKWVVRKTEIHEDHAIFLVAMDKSSIDFIHASGYELFAGVDKVDFRIVWD